jgi:hypothetical protein
MSFWFIYVAINDDISFYKWLNPICIHWLHMPPFLYPFMFDGYLGCFCILAVVKDAIDMSPSWLNFLVVELMTHMVILFFIF